MNSARGDDGDFLIVTRNFEPRDEDGRVVGFHAPHRFGTPPTNVNQGHAIITPQVHITDINRALAFNGQGTCLAGRARAAQILLSYRASYGGFIDWRIRAADNPVIPNPPA
ncbi:hypothetical protein RHMOL_Rhmol06G0126700 [Rhododendron molle]|uniref:Uncharacterized protein n=1 Tax=Rhododendron molle TaxID=49168 RepID=A0ACC0NBS9_RHOML|nr:hypothetical protein RHMOL_Rhmol06G0126700 [Rhododendron molle]